MVVALKGRLDHAWEVAALLARLVDAHTDRTKAGEVHQQVVDQVAEATVVVAPDDAAQGHAILSAERMVADEGVEFAIILGGQVLLALDGDMHLEILHGGGEPLRADLVAVVVQELVHLVLVGYLA